MFTRRVGGRSGASVIAAESATATETSAMCWAERGTSSVEPDFTSMRAGMWLTSRSSASLMPTALAASAGRMVLPTT